MILIKAKRRIAVMCPAILAAAMAGIAVPAAAGPLVVSATGPSMANFQPGQRLPDAPLLLKAGDKLVVLDKQGTRNFKGPGKFDFNVASAAAAPTAFADLLAQKPERRARIGAVRGARGATSGPPTPPGIWAVDSGKSGNVCALDMTKMALWRAEPMKAGTLIVTRSADGKSEPVSFAAGQAVANWPAALTPTSGETFAISGGATPAKVTVKSIAGAPQAVDTLGAALIENGCQPQFDRLVKAASVSSTN
jgi:hypothetical protein